MAVHADWSRTAEFAADPRSSSKAREFVSLHLRHHAMEHLVDDVRLVVSELATNAMVHAHTPFTVALQSVKELVRLEVFDGSHVGPVLRRARALDTGGRGVAIVKALSRDWGVIDRPGGKSVWAEFSAAG
jgi:anti-sigma regulatory factor (Ser/Thr protein kinase)